MILAVVLAAAAGLFAGIFGAAFYFRPKISLSEERLRKAQDDLLREQNTREKNQNDFRAVASEVMNNSFEQFLTVAMRDFRQVRTEVDLSVDKKKSLIESSFEEMKSRLEDYQKLLRKFEEERHLMYGKIDSSLSQVINAENMIRLETGALKKALTSSMGVRGKWGEQILQEILEQNGLVRGINFDSQVALGAEGEQDLRPDFVLYLPGGKKLAIDSKEVTGEYLLAQETEDPERQKEHYQKLILNIRNNFIKLGRKEYQEQLDKEVPFVVMFIPSEAAIRCAFATDPAIFQEATSRRVIMASPMTIIPLIHLIKHSWQKQKLADNALELGNAVEALGVRLFKFMEHLNNIRGGLKKAVDGWNEAAASWQSRVSPQIEKTKSLGGKLKDAEEPTLIESSLRPVLESQKN